jgi:hypothetical protein
VLLFWPRFNKVSYPVAVEQSRVDFIGGEKAFTMAKKVKYIHRLAISRESNKNKDKASPACLVG